MAKPANRDVALVTGGARRIGAAIVECLAQAGYAVAIHHNDSRSEADTLMRRILAAGGQAALVQGDLAQAETAARLIVAAGHALGPVTLLVNNASLFERDTAFDVTAAGFDRHMAINLRAPLLLARTFATLLPLDREGAIVNLLDQRVRRLNPDFLSYTLSKIGLSAATTTLAQAFAPRIRVNAVAPGPTLANIRQSAENFAAQAAATPLRRGASPDEIADAVLFLARAKAITGETIAVDGGQHLEWRMADVVNVVE